VIFASRVGNYSYSLISNIVDLPEFGSFPFVPPSPKTADPYTLACIETFKAWLDRICEDNPAFEYEIYRASVTIMGDGEVVVFDTDLDFHTWDYGIVHKTAHFLKKNLERAVCFTWNILYPDDQAHYSPRSRPELVAERAEEMDRLTKELDGLETRMKEQERVVHAEGRWQKQAEAARAAASSTPAGASTSRTSGTPRTSSSQASNIDSRTYERPFGAAFVVL
jgi:hypothetical protein